MAKVRAVLPSVLCSLLLLTATAFAQYVEIDGTPHIQASVDVTIDATKNISAMAARAMGVQAFAYDGNITADSNIPLLRNAGVTTLRFPGNAYADSYHWSQHSVTPTRGNGEKRYVAPNASFPQLMLFLEHLGGTAVITVNYGSNLQGTGPGEPKEAAAWVAYSNGNPADTRPIGKDSAGNDWKTVSYWASLRASQPLPQDDGLNFLRVGHPQSFEVGAWEIGNEVYNNGYYKRDEKDGGNGGTEDDLHVPYVANAWDNVKTRARNPKLSPETYGAAVTAYYKEMKAIDPRIRIGVAFNTQPDDSWGSNWNEEVTKASGANFDFVVLHWLPKIDVMPPDWAYADPAKYLLAPERQLHEVMVQLIKPLQKYAVGHNIGFSFAEFSLQPWIKLEKPGITGLFVADTYARLITYNTMNANWPELHKLPYLKEDGTPGPAYFGMSMVHRLMNWGEPMLSTTSSEPLLAAYADRHRDGSVGLMLINKDGKFPATVRIKVNGEKLAAKGLRWNWSANTAADAPKETEFAEGGDSFTVTVPAYTITTVTLPKQ